MVQGLEGVFLHLNQEGLEGAQRRASALLDPILRDQAGDNHAEVAKGSEEYETVNRFVECF